ncbi:hypothetical protein PAXRUDRAFT_834355, partial [Paxillus rubicundulus Ve08.2h10]
MAISTQTVSQFLVANYPDVWMSNHSSVLFFFCQVRLSRTCTMPGVFNILLLELPHGAETFRM